MSSSLPTFAVTDSGLGGLSTAAVLARRLRESALPKSRLVFFNLLADPSFGYNAMPTRAVKVEVLNRSLASLARRAAPDQVLVSCNTLSVLLPDSDVSQEIGAIGIVDASVEAMLHGLRRHPERGLIILGTPTTAASGVYPSRLAAEGVDMTRVVVEPSASIHRLIEEDPSGPQARAEIAARLEAARARLPEALRARAMVSLNCTHYGYATPVFEALMAQEAPDPVLLNPNGGFAEAALKGVAPGQGSAPEVEVISQAELPLHQREALAALIAVDAPELAEALLNYSHEPELFEWEDLRAPPPPSTSAPPPA